MFLQVGVAYLLAFESANKLIISPTENIEYDRYGVQNLNGYYELGCVRTCIYPCAQINIFSFKSLNCQLLQLHLNGKKTLLCPQELIQLLITLLQTCRLIENEYLGLKNGILDQSAILLSSYGCLTCMDCKVCILYLYNPIFRMAISKLHSCSTLFFILHCMD